MKYVDLIQTGNDFVCNMQLARNIFEEVGKQCSHQGRDCSFDSIFSAALNATKISGACISDYIEKMQERISYELAFEMYWDIITSEEKNCEGKMTAIALATLYLNETGLSSTPKSMSENFSKNRSAMMKEFRSPYPEYPLLHRYKENKKYCEYKEALSIDNLQNSSNQKGIPNCDYFFYVDKHAQSIFQLKNFESGITYTNFFDILKEYQGLRKKVDGHFDTELSAFIIEKLYYATSFSKMMLEYVSQDYVGKKLPKLDSKLFFFTKLFDSHNISLIDYILEFRKQELSSFFKDDNARHMVYIEFRWYESFLMPMLKRILFRIMDAQYNSDIILIKSKLKEYIEEKCKNSSFIQKWGYRSVLDETIRKIEELNKSFNATLRKEKDQDQKNEGEDYKIKKTRQGILFPPMRKDRSSYQFDMEISKLFFGSNVDLLLPQHIENMVMIQPTEVTLQGIAYRIENIVRLEG